MRFVGVSAGACGPRWSASAYGLELEMSFPVPDLPPASLGSPGVRTRVTLVSPAEIGETWPRDGATRLVEEWWGDSMPERTIDHHQTTGYRFFADGYGLALVSADGRQVRCALADTDRRRWQSFLFGWVLPWAALVTGIEVLHASAVAVAGRVIALAGPSGIGKSSLAVQLALAGGRFVTDDVLALDRGPDGSLRAHPGTNCAGLRAAELSRLPAADLSRLGELHVYDEKLYATLQRIGAPMPLAAIYFITRRPQPDNPTIRPLSRPGLEPLLASMFMPRMNHPRRLVNLLDVCAAIVSEVPMFEAGVHPDRDARSLAEAIRAHGAQS